MPGDRFMPRIFSMVNYRENEGSPDRERPILLGDQYFFT